MALNAQREAKYGDLKSRIGNTPLVQYLGYVPNNNRVWIKRECDNPFGSHYDRVYLGLYMYFEQNRGLKPGSNVLETTSGSAGVSFAGIGRLLGYNCYVMIPDGDHLQKRREAITQQGAKIILTPAAEYINGFTPERILENKQKYRARHLNHSIGQNGGNNEVTLASLEEIAIEVLEKIDLDIFIGGEGNGSSLIGPGRIFKKHNHTIQIIGYKPIKSGNSEAPGLINQDGLEPTIKLRFPHLIEAKKLMNREMVFSSVGMDETLGQVTALPHWDMNLEGVEEYGVSTKAGIAVALEISQEVSGKNLLVIAYDKSDRYDS